MAFECGFQLSKAATDQLIATLRASVPEVGALSREEIPRRISQESMLAGLARMRGMTPISRISPLIEKELVAEFDSAVMRQGLMVPVCRNEHRLTIAVADPYNTTGIDYCRRKYQTELVVLLTHASEINLVLEQRTQIAEISTSELAAVEAVEQRDTVKDLNVTDPHADPVIRNIQSIITTALQQRASDIHFNVEKEGLFYCFRIDGDMTERNLLDPKLHQRTDAFLTTTAGHASESRNTGMPLSGRFTVSTGNRRIAVRFERVPTYRGFHTTLRLLDKSQVNAKLGEGALDIDPVTMEFLRQIMDQPDGILVMSGATGSGKSTTLTAIIKELNFTKYNIMTLENPVEEEVKGVTHVSLDDMSKCPQFISSLLRSDPDIILVGEVRDKASAENAIEAALTGHQVFTTIHTAKASLIVARFQQLGIEKYKIAETLRGACAQRLIRTICPSCKIPAKIDASEVKRFKLPEDFVGADVFRSKEGGCSDCNKSGYRGRRAILEVLPITEEIQELIMSDALSTKIARYAHDTLRIPSLKDLALKLLRSGIADLSTIKDVVAMGLD